MSAAAPEPVSAARAAPGGLAGRLLTAAIGIPILIALVLLGGWPFALLVAGALMLAFSEYAGAVGVRRGALLFVAVGTVSALAIAARFGQEPVSAVFTAGVLLSLLALLWSGPKTAELEGWVRAVAGIAYIGLLGQQIVALRDLADGRAWVLLAFFTTFATDTGAYAIGRTLGRHKLAPRLSPGKTREGALGGLLCAAAAAVALNALLGLDRPALLMLASGGAIGVAAQLGDLAESVIKRASGVKDMGSLLPGHGGLLDRIDSLLFVAPLVYALARVLGG